MTVVTLNVEESGPPTAPTLLLVHGVANSCRTFAFAVEALGERARLLRIDLRGHGASPHVPGSYRLGDYVDDVVDLLERTGPAYVAGNSLGGAIAWTIAQRRPDLLRAVLLEDPPLRRPDATAPGLFARLRDQTARWQTDGVDPAAVAATLAETVGPHGRRAADVQTAAAIDARARALLDVDPSVFDAVTDGTTLADIDVITPARVPVRVLASDESCGSALPPESAAALLDVHPDIAFRRVTGAGHVIHDEFAHRPTWLAEVSSLLRQAR